MSLSRCGARCLRPRCIGLVALITLATGLVYYYSTTSIGTGETGFPLEAFLSNWNASPHCGEATSRRIHLMYQSQQIPAAFAEHVRSWRLHYANFEVHFWTDHSIDVFLSRQYGPGMVGFLRDYLAHGVERSDVARLLIVNHFGGLYADLDVMSLQSAEPLMRNHSLILTEEPLPHAVFIYDRPSLISNAIVYSKPCHAFWRYYFRLYPAYLRDNYGGPLRLRMRRAQRHQAVYATGPIALDKFARQFIDEARPTPAEMLVAPPVNFQPRFDAAAPSLLSLRRTCGTGLVARAVGGLSRLQAAHCRQFLDSPDSLLGRTNQTVTYTRHDYLHLGYHHKDSAATVRVDQLLPGVVLH